MIQISDLMAMGLIIFIFIHWWSYHGVRQIALAAGKSYCKKQDLQYLDDSIALQRLKLMRDDQGNIRIWRRFVFEFSSTQAMRGKGHVLTLGKRVLEIQVEAYPIS